MIKFDNCNSNANILSIYSEKIAFFSQDLKEYLLSNNFAFEKDNKLFLYNSPAAYSACLNDNIFLNKLQIKNIIYDTFTNCKYIQRLDNKFILLDEKTLNNLYLEFSKITYKGYINTQSIDIALNAKAYKSEIDKLTNFFYDLPEWDKQERIKYFFSNYVKTKHNQKYCEKIAFYLFDSILKRAFALESENKEIKTDTCLVFLGKKGLGKSSLIRYLATQKEWFTEISFTKMDEAKRLIIGKMLCEIPELKGYDTAAIEDIKAFLTATTDNWKVNHKEETKSNTRRCIFIMTSNNLNFLRESEDRRFAPIEIEQINFEKIKEDLKQIYAEAFNYFQNNIKNYDYKTEIEPMILNAQKNYLESDPWDETILKLLEEKNEIKSTDVLFRLNIPNNKQKRSDILRINKIFQRLGLKRKIKDGYKFYSLP